jgi:8-oxo-dGTP pyrophosphatase MutT (NUDIX family)
MDRPTATMIRPWKKLSSTILSDHGIFKVRCDRVINPRTNAEHEMVVLENPEWVNICALTPDNELVMVEQYRQGSETVELEIPGGLVDEGESPLDSGLRELREETGHEGENARIIGSLFANPAIMNNQVHTVLVENCVQKHELAWDEGEDILVRLVPVADIPGLIGTGKIRHSIIVAALQLFALERDD